MKIEMSFNNIPNDIEYAVADIRVEDTSEADAPAQQLFSTRTETFSIHRSQPTVTLGVNLNLPPKEKEHELSLFVRVEAHTLSNETIKFLNTTTTPLSGDPNELVRVSLERIS